MDNLPINIQNAINKFVEESKKILGKRIKKIILYGSYSIDWLQANSILCSVKEVI